MVNRDRIYSLEDRIRISRPERLDIHNEERKITIAHRLLHRQLKKSAIGYNDGGYHNLRAALINRVEALSDYDLIVVLYGADPESTARIIQRKIYLEGKNHGK